MLPNTVNCINKNLVVQNNIKKKTIAKLKRKITIVQNENKVYKEYSDGKITKQDLKTVIDKSQTEQNEFQLIKLRKVKVERAKQITADADGTTGVVGEESKKMSQLLAMFGNKPSQPSLKGDHKVEVEDYGNVEAIRAGIRDPEEIKKFMANLHGQRAGGAAQPDPVAK